MMDRQTFIDRYVQVYLERWSINIAHYLDIEYEDRSRSMARVMAMSLAETSWQVHYADYDESRAGALRERDNLG